MRKTLLQPTMKKFMLTIILMGIILMFPVKSNSFEFYGGLYRFPVNDPLTVSWNAQENTTGYQLKIIHFFYTGLETEIVETLDTSYTFLNFPKSSRHFEIQVRSYNESTSGIRSYSTWSSSTNAACSVVEGQAGGWLIYTYTSAPSW